MLHLKHYIQETLGTDLNPEPIPKRGLGNLPMFIREAYHLYNATLYKQDLILAEVKEDEPLGIVQTAKQLHEIKKVFNKKVVLVGENITAINRKRLIENGINFIVPRKQMYLPDLLIDLRENFSNKNKKDHGNKLLPSAQFILLYYILHRYDRKKLEEYTFKELAKKFNYTPMAITKAIDNLKDLELCTAEGTKEKYIRFNFERGELWNVALPLMVNPVLKKVYVDEKPKKPFMLRCNASALPEYTDMNPDRQPFFAIEKTVFYDLQKNNVLVNANEHEGKYCLEVWKYDPRILAEDLHNDTPVVDPLSLYLSLRDSHDERIEMALEKIIEKNIW